MSNGKNDDNDDELGEKKKTDGTLSYDTFISSRQTSKKGTARKRKRENIVDENAKHRTQQAAKGIVSSPSSSSSSGRR
jgi:hypothetical protein